MNNFWQSASQNPLNFSLIFTVILAGIFLFIYGLHKMLPNPVKSIIDLLKILSDEFNPKKKKNSVQLINAVGAIIFGILLLLIAIGYLSHSLLIFVINGEESPSSQLLTTFTIALFLFVFLLISSLVIINKSNKEIALQERAKKFDNN